MSHATMKTSEGAIVFELFDEDAPKTVENFKKLAGRRLLRRAELPPHHPRLHDPGRLPAGHRHRRPGLHVRGRVQRPQGRPRRARDGQRRARTRTARSSSSSPPTRARGSTASTPSSARSPRAWTSSTRIERRAETDAPRRAAASHVGASTSSVASSPCTGPLRSGSLSPDTASIEAGERAWRASTRSRPSRQPSSTQRPRGHPGREPGDRAR